MAIRKNKKFIDPRYFMDEKTDVIKEELESVMEAAPMPYGIEQGRKERRAARDRERANLPRTYYGAVDDSAKRASDKAHIEGIMNAGYHKFETQFEKTFDAARKQLHPEWYPEAEEVAVEEVKGLASALWFFARSGRFVSKQDPQRAQIHFLRRLETPKWYEQFGSIVDAYINNANQQMKDKGWGPVMDQPGMNVVAQEWEHVKKI